MLLKFFSQLQLFLFCPLATFSFSCIILSLNTFQPLGETMKSFLIAAAFSLAATSTAMAQNAPAKTIQHDKEHHHVTGAAVDHEHSADHHKKHDHKKHHPEHKAKSHGHDKDHNHVDENKDHTHRTSHHKDAATK
jgi:hypothetical protein